MTLSFLGRVLFALLLLLAEEEFDSWFLVVLGFRCCCRVVDFLGFRAIL